jgi:hypothetical protein
MADAPFPTDVAQIAISVAYNNPAYVADRVLPRVPVAGQTFKWKEFPLEQGFTLPDTAVGRRGAPNVVEFTGEERQSATLDFGLDDEIPHSDIEGAPAGYDPVGRATEGITNLIMLDREVRVARTVFNPANYHQDHRIALKDGERFSDYANSDPLRTMLEALDTCLLRPNRLVLGQGVWTKLRQHPKLVKATNGNSGDSGVITKEQLASLLEVNEVVIGQAFLNRAAKGKPGQLHRVWGNHISLIHIDESADTQNGITFGFTAQWGGRVAGNEDDSSIGLRGGKRVRVGESVRELVVANRLGVIITDAVG